MSSWTFPINTPAIIWALLASAGSVYVCMLVKGLEDALMIFIRILLYILFDCVGFGKINGFRGSLSQFIEDMFKVRKAFNKVPCAKMRSASGTATTDAGNITFTA